MSPSRHDPVAAALRKLAGPAAALAAAGLCLATSASAAEPAVPVGGARALAVSVPADPVPILPGSTTRTLIRVINPGRTAVPVTVTERRLVLGDNGAVSIGAGPDGGWQGRTRFPAGVFAVPAESWRNVPLTIHVPRGARPNLYFIGFLVTPVVAQRGSIRVVNQIGSFVTVDVPGPRVRALTGHFDMPSFVLGSHVAGTLQVSNVGHAVARFWGESDTTSSPGSSSSSSAIISSAAVAEWTSSARWTPVRCSSQPVQSCV